PPGARRESRPLGPLRDALDDGGRVGAAARDDRGVRRSTRAARCARLGQERGLDKAAAYDQRAQQGPPIPFVEIRARGEDGLVAWDGRSMGELEVRGPSI